MKYLKRIDDSDKSALIGAAGASLVPLLLQPYIPGGQIGTFIACLLFGFIVYKGVDAIF